jgi:hypothetical protein
MINIKYLDVKKRDKKIYELIGSYMAGGNPALA